VFKAVNAGPQLTLIDRQVARHLDAVFNELCWLGEWKLPNSIEGDRIFKEKDMLVLIDSQTKILLETCDSYVKIHLTWTVKVCLATSVR